MTSPTVIEVSVPATSANLGPGFDTFGMALGLTNRFHFQPAEADTLSLSPASTVTESLPSLDPADSLLFRTLDRFYQRLGKPRPPLACTMEIHIPPARGLGSSATAVVGALVAANALAAEPYSQQALLDLAIELEGHPDNVAPALLGGVTLCDGNQVTALPWPQAWRAAVVIPSYTTSTGEARKALPAEVPMSDAVFNLRKASLWTYALLSGDGEAFRQSLTDRLHQPTRGAALPDFAPLQALAQAAGAFGAVISGSGPTVAIFYPREVEKVLMERLAQYQLSPAVAGTTLQALTLEAAGRGAAIL